MDYLNVPKLKFTITPINTGKVIEIIKRHKLLNYVIKNKKCAKMYGLTDEEVAILDAWTKGTR